MGAPEGADPAVQIVAHGQFLAGGLGVEVHQGKGCLALAQDGVGPGEGVVRPPGEITAADEVHDPNPHCPQVENRRAPARGPAGEIRGPQEPGGLIQQFRDLHLAEAVVAQGHSVGPGVVDPPGLLRRQPHTGGVLPVDHSEADIFLPLQRPQAALQMGKAVLPHHVAYRQNVIQHRTSLLFLPEQSRRFPIEG